MTTSSKLLAGALLAGMGIATGQATLLATASGVGVNWLAEGLAELWPRLAAPAGQPLAAVYAASIRAGVAGLAEEFRRTVDSRSDAAAFALVAACADAMAEATFPPGLAGVDDAQRQTEAALAALLHGHDERQTAFLRRNLLPVCAAAFQRRLLYDEAAWRAFHGQMLQGLAASSALLLTRLDGFAQVLAAWSDPAGALSRLQGLTEELAALLESASAAAAPRFDNRGLRVGGNVYQAGGNQYIASAHAQGGAQASVVNYFGGGLLSQPAPAADRPVTILFLAAVPLDSEHLRLDAEARTLDDSLRRGRYADRFRLAQRWAVRSEDLLDALLRHQPAIVHFSGHGQDGELLLEDAEGYGVGISSASLARLLVAPGSVRCVLLNACWSVDLAAALAALLPCVIGMEEDMADNAGRGFAGGFYRSLADGASVAAAVEAGRGLMAVGGGRGVGVHVQTHPGVDAAEMRFAQEL